ncbi:hypothetical protein HMPREF9577_00906 [Cutibacterium acnes HL110PA3]|nr:hypothetical protein HMPREF9603_02424 [Cutibacterium acnes HL001PA1]EFT26405.1 hypothetical protein HMPREF9577_00906 [Cutibacterium acnes HL110PA3]
MQVREGPGGRSVTPYCGGTSTGSASPDDEPVEHWLSVLTP